SVTPVPGSALTPGQLAAVPASLDFGVVDLDAGTTAQASLVLTNLGGAPITNGLASVGGGPFAIVSGAAFSLAGFGSTNLALSFNPASEGNFSNVVILTSSGGNSTNVLTGAAAKEPQAGFVANPTNGLKPLSVTF